VGVNLFFILSGFLITRILINAKQQRLGNYLKNFYLRRTLRIFPLYFFYLLLAFCGLLLLHHFLKGRDEIIEQGISDFKRNSHFLVTYTYNFEGIINFLTGKDYHNSMFTGHLWSLAVEEQFYLIFPFIIYFFTVPSLKKIFLFIIFLIPFLRLLFVIILKAKVNDLFWIGDILYTASPFQLDSLCMGACLVLFDFTTIIKKAPLYLSILVSVMTITGIIHLQVLKNYGMSIPLSSLGYDNPVYHLLMPTPNSIINNRYFYSMPLINCIFGLIMLLAINGKFLTKLLESKWLVFLGKISYGVYIYHLGFSYLFTSGVKSFSTVKISHGSFLIQGFFMLLFLTVLVILSFLSFQYFEKVFYKRK
jgi:peptidoglycan/LPS O-acetylase OafA/YrhL